MTINVEGLPELQTDLKGLSADLADIPMDEISHRGVSIASSLAPRRTGNLASSIRPAAGKDKAYVTATASYAPTINYGSVRRGISATYFMNRVDAAWMPQAETILDNEVQALIQKRDLQ